MMDVASSFSTAPRAQKRKTYGKRTTSSTYTLSMHEESPQKPKATRAIWSPEPSPPSTTKKETLAVRPSAGKLKRPSPRRPRQADLFDISSSGEEHLKVPSPQKISKPLSTTLEQAQSSINDVRSSSADSDKESKGNMMKKRKRDVDSAEAQLLQESIPSVHTNQKAIALDQLGRLKKDNVRAAIGASHALGRISGASSIAPRTKAQEQAPQRTAQKSGHQPPKRVKTPSPMVLANASSPARLEAMILDIDNDSDTPFTSNPGKRLQSPTKQTRFNISSSPRTPPYRESASPASAARSGSVTPRQTELWTKLLGRAAGTDSPGKLPVQQLRISSASKEQPSTLRKFVSDSNHSTRVKRARLIDTLAKETRGVDDSGDVDNTEITDEDSVANDKSSNDREDTLQHADVEGLPAPVSQGGTRVTYGQTRSYVEESTLDAELLLDSPIVPIKHGSSARLEQQNDPSQSFSALSQDDDDLDEGQGAMKSVHELRAAGENRRFADDFENTLDDIQARGSASWSRQRAGMIELCGKLMEKKFVARLVNSGLDDRLLKACAGASDTVFNFAVAVAIALIANADAPMSVLGHIQRSSCFDMLFTLLDVKLDMKTIARDRKSNMSKIAQVALGEFCTEVKESSLWTGQVPESISSRVIALKAIDLLVRRIRQLGNMDELLDEQKTSQLLLILEQCLNDHNNTQAFDPLCLELALSILESGSVIPGRIQTAWTPKRMARLAGRIPDLLRLGPPASTVVTPLALRLMLNLTNTNAKASNIFAEAPIVQLLVSSILGYFENLSNRKVIDDEEEAVLDDGLILSLGTMINLTEFADAARTPILGDHQHLLNGLVTKFNENHDKTAEADTLARTASNVAHGYLTVLLGNFCQNEGVRHATAEQLPGKNLFPLIEAIEEFVAYNKVADRSAFEGDEGANVYRVFTERLADVAARLRETETAMAL